jgi:signal transduction histidine kinase
VPSPRRGVTTVYEGSAVVAALVHDPALRHEPDLLEAGVAIAGAAIERTRLAAHAEAATAELQRSRARIAASAERERRRIERDLHDGAQQRLVALRIEMDLTEELVHRSPDEAAARMQQLAAELDIALEEIRSLAHGMYPPLLADRGLSDALRAIARGSAVPVDVEAHEVRRYAPEVESAVYFCVRESLQNALKHAPRARRIVVRVDGGGGELRFSVHDDGAGAPGGELRPGVGITNMQDRLAAVGGELAFRSTPGVGTVVRGRVRSPGSPSGPDVPAG